MGFWKGWALWQKLSVALAFLLALVLVYSFSVLTYNRRKIKKRAAEEACQRAEQEAEMGTAKSETNDIPFGARALEKGIEVEGIWTIKSHSLSQQPSVSENNKSSGLSSFLGNKPPQISLQTPHALEHNSQRTLKTAESPADSLLESIQIDTFSASRPPKLDIYGIEGPKPAHGHVRPLSRGWFASRSSWITWPFEGYKRMSVREGHHRTSSEDFRRRFSKLFDETLPPGPPRPTEMFQLTPIYQESAESLRRGSRDKVIERAVTK